MLVTSVPMTTFVSADEPRQSANRPSRLPPVHAMHDTGVATIKASKTKASIQFAAHSSAPVRLVSEPTETVAAPENWLRSTTADAAAEVARRLVVQASQEYNTGAWLSAETTAWEAIRFAARSIELTARQSATPQSAGKAEKNLQIARQAIREARDFSGIYGPVDADVISRMSRSHQTSLLDDTLVTTMSATDAADRYLDYARVKLASIASESVEAAQALDLLAAVYLERAEAKTMPSATALCLRRAALQGQPNNASLASRLGIHLAEVGLYGEARWALEHSLALDFQPQTADALVRVLRHSGENQVADELIASLQKNDNSRVTSRDASIPEITQLSPAEFATISQPVMPSTPSTSTAAASLASAKMNVTPEPIKQPDPSMVSPALGPQSMSTADAAQDPPGAIRRFFSFFKRIW